MWFPDVAPWRCCCKEGLSQKRKRQLKKEARKLKKENKLKKEKQVTKEKQDKKDQKCNRANKKLSLPSSETGLGNLWAKISPPKGRGRRRKRKRKKKVAEGNLVP